MPVDTGAYEDLAAQVAELAARLDNDRGYAPGNVRWATAKEQAANRGSSS